MNKKCGIYCIENILDGKIYIGQTVNFTSRKSDHFSKLKRNIHKNIHLQTAYNKHGKDNFIFKIMLFCEREELTYYEQSLVDKLNPHYNILKECVDSQKGRKLSEQEKTRISERSRGRIVTKEQRDKISETLMGHSFSDETKLKISNTLKERNTSAEAIKEISDGAKRGWEKRKERETLEKLSEDYVAPIPKIKKSRRVEIDKRYGPRSKEIIEKMSALTGEDRYWSFGIPRTQNVKDKIAEKLKGKKRSGTYSKYLGVSYYKKSKSWNASIIYNKEKIYIGSFKTEIEAALAVNEYLLEYYGWKAKLNVIPEEEIRKLWEDE